MRKSCVIGLICSLFFTIGYFLKSYEDGDLKCVRYPNSLQPLDIETYDGGGEGLHPKCLYFHNGWNGAKFWFTFTPYKDMNEAIENPCIYTSNNGEDFIPVLSAYPLDDISMSKKAEFNSDPHLVFNPDSNRIECFWRRVQTGDYPDKDRRYLELIYRSWTKDGVSWSDKELILEYHNNVEATRGAICPVVHYDEGRYIIWVSCSEDIDGQIRYIDCYEYTNDGYISKINRTPLQDCKPSHFDVVKKDSLYYLCAQDIGEEGFPYKLFVASSPYDDFESCGKVLTTGSQGSWDSGRLYRPSLTIVDGAWWLYYSAYRGNESHVGLIKFDAWSQLSPQIVDHEAEIYKFYRKLKSLFVKHKGR